MFFLVSKVAWFFLTPAHVLFLGAFLGAVAATGRFARTGRAVAILCAAAIILVGAAPISVYLIRPLEDRFPPPRADAPTPTGVIVLGGAIVDELTQARGQVSFGEGAGRLVEAAVLARRYPQAKVVYTGGGNSLFGDFSSEAEDAKNLFVALGIAADRILLEGRSLNTDENARFTRDLVSPKPNEVWLLVTSAYHMPRAMGLFRHAGFNVVAYPVDYHSYGNNDDLWLAREAPINLRLLDIAVHEWIGLIAYRALGKIDDWFPAP